MIAKDIMDPDFICVSPDMPLREAALLMTTNHRMLLPVITDDGCGTGVLMEADLLRLILPRYLDTLQNLDFLPDTFDIFPVAGKIDAMQVKDALTDHTLYTISHDSHLPEIAHRMLTKGIAALAVEEDGKIIGYVTRGRLLTYFFEYTTCQEETDES